MTGFLLAVRRPNRVPENTKVVAGDLEKELRRSAETWRKWYDWLQWYFPDEEAHDYAEELTQVAEGRKRETERSPHEIKREMKFLANIEALINARRLVVTIAALASPFYFLLLRPSFLDSLLDSETAAATWVCVGVGISCVVLAVVVWNRPFWDNCLTVLRRTRLGCFWEWRSVTLRFPVKPSSRQDSSTRAKGKRQIAAVRSFMTGTLRFLKTQAITRRKLAIQHQSSVRLHPGQNARFSATASAFSRLLDFFAYRTRGVQSPRDWVSLMGR
jgi:hypothetical protein